MDSKLSKMIKMFEDEAVRVIRDGYMRPEWVLKHENIIAELKRVSAIVVRPIACIR
jgi:hypothetical protein